MVWKASEKVGFGKAGSGLSTYIVGLYEPRGNMLGRFEENVDLEGGASGKLFHVITKEYR